MLINIVLFTMKGIDTIIMGDCMSSNEEDVLESDTNSLAINPALAPLPIDEVSSMETSYSSASLRRVSPSLPRITQVAEATPQAFVLSFSVLRSPTPVPITRTQAYVREREQRFNKYRKDLDILVRTGWLPEGMIYLLNDEEYKLLKSEIMQSYIADNKIDYQQLKIARINDAQSSLVFISSDYNKLLLERGLTNLSWLLYLSKYFILDEFDVYFDRNKYDYTYIYKLRCYDNLQYAVECLDRVCFIKEKHLRIINDINNHHLLSNLLDGDLPAVTDFRIIDSFFKAIRDPEVFDSVVLSQFSADDVLKVCTSVKFYPVKNLDNPFVKLALAKKQITPKEVLTLKFDLSNVLPDADSFLYGLFVRGFVTMSEILWLLDNNYEKLKSLERPVIKQEILRNKLNYRIFLGLLTSEPELQQLAQDYLLAAEQRFRTSITLEYYSSLYDHVSDVYKIRGDLKQQQEQFSRRLLTTMWQDQPADAHDSSAGASASSDVSDKLTPD
jgi:hypothetical protein